VILFFQVHRNRDPALHPLERAREYTKALVATKLDKILAKPFIGALDGHTDGIFCMSTIRNKDSPFISGACDGELKIWDLSRRMNVWSTIAHSGFVRGISPDCSGRTFFTCGDDKTIKHWTLESSNSEEIQPINVVTTPHSLTSIDHNWTDEQYATSGEVVSIWDYHRLEPIHTYKWGADSVTCLKYNPSETYLIASAASDRSVALYDIRSSLPLRKFLLPMKTNCISWNPQEPINFLLANEDFNVYQFDMRNLKHALMIHKDHISAVMSVAFSPTGREFATGSYDRTVRLFHTTSGHSHEVYHGKRMQRVFCVSYSDDSRFVLSGSDDTNIRIWKTNASESLAVIAGREQRKLQLNQKLKKRYGHMPEINRISKDHKVPKFIKKAQQLRHVQRQSEHRKEENRKRHSSRSADGLADEPERKRAVIKEFE